MGINTGNNVIKGINVGSNVISRAFLGSVKIYDQLDYPTLDLNFAATKTLDSKITFTRASSGTYFDSNRVMQLASANTPRFNHNPNTKESLGLLIEEQRTNSIRNNTMQGAVAGTPGTLPTNWGINFNTTTGITRSVVGAGVEDGISYIDIQFVGTASGAGSVDIFFEIVNAIAAATGQTWGASFYWKLQAGSFTGLSDQRFFAYEYNSSSGYVNAPFAGTPANPTSAALCIQRFTGAATLAGGASTAFVRPLLKINIANGAAINITLRIGMPQLEQGAFATSVIPTSGAAATRAADVATMTGTNFSSWYRQDEGTFYVEGSCSNFANSPIFVIPHNGTSNNYLNSPIMTTGGNARISGVVSGVSWTNVTTANSVAVNTTAKVSATYRASDQATCLNGGAVATGTNTSLPAVTTLNIGTWRTGAGNSINGHIRRIAYYPRRLANTELQLLSL